MKTKLLSILLLSIALTSNAMSPTNIVNNLCNHKTWVLQVRLGHRGQGDTWYLRKSPYGSTVARISSKDAKAAIKQGSLVATKGLFVVNYRAR